MPKLSDINSNSQQNVNIVASRDGGIAFVDSKVKDPNGSLLPEDRSFSVWQNAWKTLVKIFQGNITMSGAGNVSINSTELHQTAHLMQTTTSGGYASYHKGESIEIKGEISADERAKIQQYQNYLNQITTASQNAVKNTKGEEVACPVCAQSQLADDKSDPWNTILDAIRQASSNIPWAQGPFAVLRFLITKIYIPLLSVKTNVGLNGGKGCGPGCNNGIREGLATPLTAGETELKTQMDALAGLMNDLTASMNNNSGQIIPYSHGATLVVGDPQGSPKTIPYLTKNTYHTYPSNLRPSPTLHNKLRVTTEGNCKQVIYQPPLQSPFGNFMLNVENNVKITSGNAGIDLMSTGEIAVKGGSVHINGSQGEVSLTSNNLTTIGGANVLIAADPRSGDSGVTMDSKHVFVKGAFNVAGDSAMLGSLTLDGALNVNYINCPTMAAPSTLNGTDNFTTHHTNWSYKGTALNAANLAVKITNMATQPSLLFTGYGVTNIFMEAYNLAMMSIPLEVHPTGIFFGMAGPFPCAGVVINFPHNHTQSPDDHTHEVPVPKGGYYKQMAGAGQSRSVGNPAPTPAPTSSTYPCPGPRSWGGGCGGGGLFSKVRNQKYGINNDDAFDGGNFVTTTVTRNPDGSIYPPPDLTYRVVNDTGSGSNTGNGSLSGVPVNGIVTC
jgi:hypothetical protein